MNARTELAPGVSRAPKRSDYIPIVRGLRPLCEGEELELRSSLLLMRDRAIATKPRATEYAWPLLDLVERIASDNALNHKLHVDELRELRRICGNIVCAASSLDGMYQPRLPLENGEAHGRGA